MYRLSKDGWVLSLEEDMEERLQYRLQCQSIFDEVMPPNKSLEPTH
jgi:hypothetical protein